MIITDEKELITRALYVYHNFAIEQNASYEQTEKIYELYLKYRDMEND